MPNTPIFHSVFLAGQLQIKLMNGGVMKQVIIEDTKIIEVLLVDETHLESGIEILTDVKLRPFIKTTLNISKQFYNKDFARHPDEVKLLADIILHHVKEEDRAMIPRIMLDLTPEDLQKMGEEFIRGLTDEDIAS
jgi:hypothetical protein